MSDEEEAVSFDVSRSEKPMNQAELILRRINKALDEPPGSHERTMRLADVQCLLAPQLAENGEDYRKKVKEAKEREKAAFADGDMDAHADFQAEWLSFMMELMEAGGLLGKRFVKG